MPTYFQTSQFRAEFKRLKQPQRDAFIATLRGKFIPDLEAIEQGRRRQFRSGLGVKPYRGDPGTLEMRWDDDGRALWRYGAPEVQGLRHVVWVSIGTHDIY